MTLVPPPEELERELDQQKLEGAGAKISKILEEAGIHTAIIHLRSENGRMTNLVQVNIPILFEFAHEIHLLVNKHSK
jgi:hypothetical protein